MKFVEMHPKSAFSIFILCILSSALTESNADQTAKGKLDSLLRGSRVLFPRSSATTGQQDAADDPGHTLVHGSNRTTARPHHGTPRPGFLSDNDTVLKSYSYPTEERLRPTIGNGHVATVLKNDGVFMNALYNGHNLTSHRARIPSPLIANLSYSCPILFNDQLCNSALVSYALDTGRGTFEETHVGDHFVITLTSYAHRAIPQLLVQELEITNTHQWSLKVNTYTNKGNESEDIDFTTQMETNAQIQTGRTRLAEYDITGLLDVTVVSSIIPKTIVVGPQQRETHLLLVSVDKDYSKARRAFDEGVAKFMSQTLHDSHSKAWFDVWRRGRVTFEGNNTLSQLTYSSLYYILSAIPLKETSDFVGLAPGDLAHGVLHTDYQGHIFWDQETWMYPPLQLLHTDVGKTIINSRVRVLDTAKQYAQSRGYRGAMFPWESALSGLNVCPWDLGTIYEQHVTGDVALALRQYVMMTNDTDFLSSGRGLETMTEIANFWASRVQLKPGTNMYEILDVMPPDESHHRVNNSVYTNVIAKISLLNPQFVSGLLGRSSDSRYEDIANRMYIPYDSQKLYHPEYEGYTQDVSVKQADVALLGFPLMEPMSVQVRRNDLNHYKSMTPLGGPAMTWGVYCIGYLELNETKNAEEMFVKQFDTIVRPFNVWTERINLDGAVNFITAMGGYLQTLIFGYGGFRMYPDYLEFRGIPPPGVQSFNVTGVDYLGGSFDFTFLSTAMIVTQTKMASRPFQIRLYKTGVTQAMAVGNQMLYESQKAAIMLVLK